MFSQLFILSFALLSVCGDVDRKAEGKHWGLIVAGSNMWYNYRHQVHSCTIFHFPPHWRVGDLFRLQSSLTAKTYKCARLIFALCQIFGA